MTLRRKVIEELSVGKKMLRLRLSLLTAHTLVPNPVNLLAISARHELPLGSLADVVK